MIRTSSYRKICRLLAVILAALLTTVLFSLSASAEGESGVWQITLSDGNVSYSDDAVPFAVPQDGATYKLLADSVSWNEANYIPSDASYTVDLSGKTVYADSGYNTTPFALAGAQNVTFLLDGTTFSISTRISTFINLAGSGDFVFDGGESGFYAYCPCFVNCVGTSEALVKNGSLYKNSGNVKALLCARDSGRLTIDHSSAFGAEQRSPLFLNNSASITLISSTVVGIGQTAVYCDLDDGVKLIVKENSVVSGSMTGFSYLEADPGTRFTDVRSSMLRNEVVIREILSDLFFTYSKMNEDGTVTEETEEIYFQYLVSGKGKVTSEQTDDSVWMILDSELSASYIDDFYTPFAEITADSIFVLLKDAEIPFFPRVLNARAFQLDFSGRTVKQSCDIPTLKTPALLTVLGSGSISLNLSGALISAEETMLLAELADKVDVTANDAFVFAPTVFLCPGAGVTLVGGYFDGACETENAMRVGGLFAEHARIVFDSEYKQAVKASGNVSLTDTHVIARNYGGALLVENTLTADAESPIYGSVTALRIAVGVGNLFAGKVKAEKSASVLFVDQATPYSLLTFSYDGEKVIPSVTPIAFTKVSSSPLSGLKASLYFGPEVFLYLYVPETTVKFSSDFSVRISVNGILYEAAAKNGILREIDGVTYYRFTYRYLYHNQAMATASCSLVLGGIASPFGIDLLSLLTDSVEAAEGENQRIIANYLAYTFYVSEIDNAVALLLPYLDLISDEKAECVENKAISKIVRAAAFNPRTCTLEFAFAEDFKQKVTLSYLYDGKRKTVTADASSVDTFTVPIYRMPPSSELTFSFEEDGAKMSVTVSLLTFAALSEDTLSADDLDRYIAYLTTLR